MRRLFYLLACLSLSAGPTACHRDATSRFPGGRIVDLSHPFDAQTIYWPTEDGFKLEKEHDGITDKGYHYASNKFSAPEHGGTHIDAPRHFAANANTLEQIPLEQLTGEAILFCVTRTKYFCSVCWQLFRRARIDNDCPPVSHGVKR